MQKYEWRKIVDQLLSLRKKCLYSELFWSAFFSHFPAFGMNTERYDISLRIQFKCGKIRTRITLNTDTFCAVSKLDFKVKKHADRPKLSP